MAQFAVSEPKPGDVWPFWTIWRFLTWIVKLTGRLIAIVLGFAMIIIGAVLSITVILLPLGIPLIIFGFLVVMRGLF